MKTLLLATALAAGLILSGAASAGTAVVDGTLDASYGSAVAHITHDASAPTSNFSSPTAGTTAGPSYDIWLTSDANNVYGFLKPGSDGASAGNFANLYFDFNTGNGANTDAVFEITNDNLYIGSTLYHPAGVTSVTNGSSIEFSIANSTWDHLFAAPGANANGQINLVGSQSYGYTLAGISGAGVRLGGAGAVPEPASWALMILGFGGIGAAARKRRASAAFA